MAQDTYTDERTVAQRLKDVETSAVKNAQGVKVVSLMHENKRLRDSLGRAKRKSQSSTSKIKGLGSLGSKPTLPI